ncbi:MAG: hypothetical protein FJ202_12930 [Gemmatimonadetes bacterium]|nr:hypothetical protein [Gemmatimonadota bacterium]
MTVACPIEWLLLLHAAMTLFMVGVIWFVQVVHYPLFSRVGEAAFPEYGRHHVRRTGWVVGLPMLVELGAAIAIVWCLGGVLAWWGMGLPAADRIRANRTTVGFIPVHAIGREFRSRFHGVNTV